MSDPNKRRYMQFHKKCEENTKIRLKILCHRSAYKIFENIQKYILDRKYESQKRFTPQNKNGLSKFAISASFRDMNLIRSALERYLTIAQVEIKKVNQNSKKVVQKSGPKHQKWQF